MNKQIFNIPNCITLLRVIGTLSLLFITPLSVPFFIIYTLSGITDVLDGTIARLTKTETSFGRRLDSVADLSFYSVMLIRIFPILWDALPHSIWIVVGLVIGIRLLFYTIGLVKNRRLPSSHSLLNKLTGFMIFAVPYILKTAFFKPYCWGICLISAVGTLEDLTNLIGKKKDKTQIKQN
ncbi:MAG: CDP-alcohol phosphatidyltransferase family protein [Ruminococcaceae bacterium]|nr:CDP-alcohol phosphatidyltransferase family protein [Oscillospiraceae bacterium]